MKIIMKKLKRKTKWMGLLLAFCMALSIMPMTVYAEPEDDLSDQTDPDDSGNSGNSPIRLSFVIDNVVENNAILSYNVGDKPQAAARSQEISYYTVDYELWEKMNEDGSVDAYWCSEPSKVSFDGVSSFERFEEGSTYMYSIQWKAKGEYGFCPIGQGSCNIYFDGGFTIEREKADELIGRGTGTLTASRIITMTPKTQNSDEPETEEGSGEEISSEPAETEEDSGEEISSEPAETEENSEEETSSEPAASHRDETPASEPEPTYEQKMSKEANAPISVAGKDVKTSVSGVYAATKVRGTAVMTSAADVKTTLGLTAKQQPTIYIYDVDTKKSKMAMASINAAADALGTNVVACLQIELGAKENGKWVTLKDGSVALATGLPKSADTSLTYYVICVQAGGVITVLEDLDTDPSTVTFAVNAGLGAYAIVAK